MEPGMELGAGRASVRLSTFAEHGAMGTAPQSPGSCAGTAALQGQRPASPAAPGGGGSSTE